MSGYMCGRGFCEEVVVGESTLGLRATNEPPSHVVRPRAILLHLTLGQGCLGSWEKCRFPSRGPGAGLRATAVTAAHDACAR